MALAWSFEIYKGVSYDSYGGFTRNAIYLMPFGTLLFALWYFEAVRIVIGIQYCEALMISIKWLAYVSILFTYGAYVIFSILNPVRSKSYDRGTLDYGIVIPVGILGVLAVILLAFSVFKINRFSL